MTTTRLPDSADFYTAERAVREEVIWVLEAHHLKHLAFLEPHLKTEKPLSVLEFGCGAGLLARDFPQSTDYPKVVDYLGIDKNSFFIEKAKSRCHGIGGKHFQCWNVRNFDGGKHAHGYDLSMAWNFLKHFHLDEWEERVVQLLSYGRFGAFNMQVMESDREDGKDFPHTFVTRRRLEEAVKAAGHQIEEVAIHGRWALQDVGMAEDMVVWTRRISTEGDFVKPDGSIVKMLQGLCSAAEEIKGTPAATDFSIPPEGKKLLGIPDQWLEIDKERATPLADYSLLWTDDETPVLYHKGKRVTRAWRLQLDVSQPEDKEGGSANTAE